MTSVGNGFPGRRADMRLIVIFGGLLFTFLLFTCTDMGIVAQSISADPRVNALAANIDVYDGFDGPKLSKLWETSRFSPGAVKITVHPRDEFEAGQNGDSDSERDELLEARKLTSKEGVAYEYSFSMFFPKDFPIVPTRLVIAQWKQFCPDSRKCNDSPVLALRYISGELRITQDIGKQFIVLYREKGEFRNRWLDFRIQARFSPREDGRVKVWLDGKQVVDFKGVTANLENATTGYPSPSYFYFKMGLYRNVMAAPMSIYIDEYRKRQLRDGDL